MKRRVLSAIVIGLALLFAAALFLYGLPSETKDRNPPKWMAWMVRIPISAVRERGLADGDAEFERIVANQEALGGSGKVRIADLYMSYGVQLHEVWMESDDRVLLQASRDRIWASIPRYRAAFGSTHPEVAVALHTAADIDRVLNGRLTPQAEAALWEAWKIRRDALGPQNAETLAVEEQLARIARVRKVQRARRNAGPDRTDSGHSRH